MEAVPISSRFETTPEVDLLEVFREKEVTIFGLTGTFGDLAEMCPIDLQAEHISLETKNEFVVKAANEAGLEVGREYEPVFAKYIEQNKLERKVTFSANQLAERNEAKQTLMAERATPRALTKDVATGSIEPLEIRRSHKPQVDVLTMQRFLMPAREAGEVEAIQVPPQQRRADAARPQPAVNSETVPVAIERPAEVVKPILVSPAEAFSEPPDSLASYPEKMEITRPRILYPDEVVLFTPGFEPVVYEGNAPYGTLQESIDVAAYHPPQQEFGVKAESVMALGELPTPPQELVAVIDNLAAVLETAEPDQLQNFEAILEEIMSLPDKLDPAIPEHMPVIEDKLAVLFVQLFEEAGIDYTPELVDSFVILTKRHFLKNVLSEARGLQKSEKSPEEIGTREFLQLLHHGLSRMKQAVFHFYEIGQSVMRLYGQDDTIVNIA